MFVKVGILVPFHFSIFSCLNHFSPVLFLLLVNTYPVSASVGSALRGGIGVLAYIWPTTSPPVLPSTIMGTHSTSTFLYVQHGVPSLSKVPSLPIWGFIPTQGSILTICGP